MFKPGDVVECVDDEWATPYLEAGRRFVVETATTSFVRVQGSSVHWLGTRFRPVLDLGVAFRVRTETVKHFEASGDGGKTWVPVPDRESLK